MGAQPPTIKQIQKRPRVSTLKETKGLSPKRDSGAKGLNAKRRLRSQGCNPFSQEKAVGKRLLR